MKLLHVYAGPFPTVQGTQALVDATCALLSQAGHEVHLLAYAHAPVSGLRSYVIHRVPDWPKVRGERSGPSLAKVALDIRLAAATRRLVRRLQPDLVHAHHYEALVACRLADPLARLPLVFHCHALLGPELETYFPGWLSRLTRLAGMTADRTLPRLSSAIGAVTPEAVSLLAKACPGTPVRLLAPHLPLPCPVTTKPMGGKSSLRAIYIGNLDAYQDLPLLLEGLSALPDGSKAHLEVLIATASDSTDLKQDLQRRGLASLVRVVAHGSPGHAAALLETADIALIPRTTRGGVPIKLINALNAGVPVLADIAARDFLEHGVDATLVDMSNPAAVAQALTTLAADPKLRQALSNRGRLTAHRLFGPQRALQDLVALYALAQTLNERC
jgi:glycosyltransferase involved in cell wall biosynthesis